MTWKFISRTLLSALVLTIIGVGTFFAQGRDPITFEEPIKFPGNNSHAEDQSKEAHLRTLDVLPEQPVASPTNQLSEPHDEELADAISFSVPTGYVRDIDQLPWDGVEKNFYFVKEEYLYPAPAETSVPAIDISFYQNPDGLSVLQWLEKKGGNIGYGLVDDRQSTATSTFLFKDRVGIRFVPPWWWGDLFMHDRIAVSHKSTIILISNMSVGPDDPQNQVFEQMLASMTFANE